MSRHLSSFKVELSQPSELLVLCGNFSKEEVSDVDILELWLKAVMQYRWFISISLEKNPKSACDEDPAVVAILIRKL